MMGEARDGLFPVRAGMNRTRASAARSSRRFPRVCGDEPDTFREHNSGAPLFPACAGMNLHVCSWI